MIGQTMMATGKRLDWDGWFRGLMGATISGGAGAFGSGTAEIYLDPKHVATEGLHHVFALMGMTFLISAVISLLKFLQTSPVPAVVDKTGATPTQGPGA
jgi:hypothetical protein